MTDPGLTLGVTVAICTYNRSGLLRVTLESMTRMTPPADCHWELLVVANACTDDTERVVEEFGSRLPIRCVREDRPGKSHAANTAVEEARGRYVVWTDDDVLVSREWLASYSSAFARHPTVGMFGGPIEAHFLGEGPPPWADALLRIEGRIWAAVEPGRAIEFTREKIPLGANMAFARDRLLRRPFDARVGPRPGSEIRGEETVLVHQLMDAGERGLWVPEARVAHMIPPQRQTLDYVRRYFAGAGQTAAILSPPQGRVFLGRPLWAWRQAVESECRYRIARWRDRPDDWLPYLLDASRAWGVLRGPR